jgi:signal-transduction protein with cAMP-binding, CBS, and nucleotidyltransferase domain
VHVKPDIPVRDAMSPDVLTIHPGETMQEAARQMTERNVGSAVVVDPRRPWPGIVTERDLLQAIADGKHPEREPVAANETRGVVFAAPGRPPGRAAATMIGGHFRHLVVVEGRRAVGMLSMRDIVRSWVRGG